MLVFLRLSAFELGARTGRTDGRTDGRARPVVRPISIGGGTGGAALGPPTGAWISDHMLHFTCANYT